MGVDFSPSKKSLKDSYEILEDKKRSYNKIQNVGPFLTKTDDVLLKDDAYFDSLAAYRGENSVECFGVRDFDSLVRKEDERIEQNRKRRKLKTSMGNPLEEEKERPKIKAQQIEYYKLNEREFPSRLVAPEKGNREGASKTDHESGEEEVYYRVSIPITKLQKTLRPSPKGQGHIVSNSLSLADHVYSGRLLNQHITFPQQDTVDIRQEITDGHVIDKKKTATHQIKTKKKSQDQGLLTLSTTTAMIPLSRRTIKVDETLVPDSESYKDDYEYGAKTHNYNKAVGSELVRAGEEALPPRTRLRYRLKKYSTLKRDQPADV
eukprot:Nk52_evm32s158 gene=Nk52_evmTU32s158